MSTTVSTETDVAVVGAGPGGYVAAIRAGQLGLDVMVVEKGAVGGVCLNRGCIPSKALISATGLADRASSAEAMGIDAEISMDVERMVDWKDGIVERLTGGVERLCRANGVDMVKGRAEFVDGSTLRVEGTDAPNRIQFGNAIVATGSRPMQLPRFDFDDDPVLSSREALSPDSVPDRLLTIGAGYIGMELSNVYAKLGSDVTVVEMLDSVLPAYEDDIGRVVRRRSAELGIDFRLGEGAREWERTDDGIVVTTESETGETHACEADGVLVAVGRTPLTETLSLENAGVATDDDGVVRTDADCRTDVPGIYAVGDVSGEPMLAHAASWEGIVAAHDIAGDPIDAGDRIVPAAVFTDPEIGTIGMTEAEAAAVGFDPVVGEMPFNASGRALTTGKTAGFVRVVASSDGGLLGAQIVGPDASELVAELAFAIKHRASLSDIAETIHVHPTLSEVVMEAAENALGRAIYTTNR